MEVNFVPDLKILHDAGYNVLTYDLRNHGLSGSGNGGRVGSGWFEARDVVGSLSFARDDERMRGMPIGPFSRCLGCNSTFAASTQFAAEFAGVRCLVGAQPVTPHIIIAHQLALAGVPAHEVEAAMADLDERITLGTSLSFAARDNREWARSVGLPTYLYGVYDDALTDHSDLQTQFDNLAATEKQLQWVRDTPARWDGYLEFQRRPQPMLQWFDRYMA